MSEEELSRYLENPERYAGASSVQTEEFLTDYVSPRLALYKEKLDMHHTEELSV